MTRDQCFLETLVRVTRDLDALPNMRPRISLLFAARGAEVLNEGGYAAMPVGGQVIWQVYMPGNLPRPLVVGFSNVWRNTPPAFCPPMHCWIMDRQTSALIDFSVDLLKMKAVQQFGTDITQPTCGSYLWLPPSYQHAASPVRYRAIDAATVAANRAWAHLVTGPLRLQLDCDCGMVQRGGHWQLPYRNGVPWRGRRAATVCPQCRAKGKVLA